MEFTLALEFTFSSQRCLFFFKLSYTNFLKKFHGLYNYSPDCEKKAKNQSQPFG